MPVHDWTNVDAGIFHAFHHSWIEEIQRALNRGLLPDNYYALPEQSAGGLGPDVLTLQTTEDADATASPAPESAGLESAGLGPTVLLAPPQARLVDEVDLDFYRRKQKRVVVRHVSDDSVVAVIEIVSQGNKSSRSAIASFVKKVEELLEQRVHVVLADLFPPGPRDPPGIHTKIWESITNRHYELPQETSLTLAAYESAGMVRAFVEHCLVGEAIPEMPLFLQPGAHLPLPLEATYNSAFLAVPRRWRQVLEKREGGMKMPCTMGREWKPERTMHGIWKFFN